MSGLSWFGVLSTTSLPPVSIESQAQPLPNRVAAAFENCSWKLWKLSNV